MFDFRITIWSGATYVFSCVPLAWDIAVTAIKCYEKLWMKSLRRTWIKWLTIYIKSVNYNNNKSIQAQPFWINP